MIDKMYYTLEQHLEIFKEISQDYADIYASWLLDKKAIGKVLNAVSHFYPHYSDHDESHSRKLIKNIEMLLGIERIKELSPTDTWLILMSAYLHDAGMVLVNEVLDKKWDTPDFQDFLKQTAEGCYNSYDEEYIEASKYLLSKGKNDNQLDWPLKVRYYVILIAAEYFRRSHGEYSKKALNTLEEYGLSIAAFQTVPNRIKNLIGQVAFLHGRNFKEVMELDYKANGIGTDLIHPRFVAMMIRLGDLLDLDDGRFTSVFQKMIYKIPNISQVHMGKHSSIRHFLIDPDGIEIVADCDTTEIYRETKSWIDWLEDEIKNLATNWSQIVQKNFYGGPPRLNKQSLFLKGKKDRSEQTDLRFGISIEKTFDILQGASIYDTKLVFIRELVQNALDASKMQMWMDICNGIYDSIFEKENEIKNYIDIKTLDDIPSIIWNNYSIKICTNLDKKTSEITFSIEDRGCGFTMQDLIRFTEVGESWGKDGEKAKIIGTMPFWLRPTGAFGLGVQSLFLVTDEIVIYTKSDGENPKRVTAVSRKKNGYITLEEPDENIKRGSKIVFKIGEEVCKAIVENDTEVDPFIPKIDYCSIFIGNMERYFTDKISDSLFLILYNGENKVEQQFYWIKNYKLDEFKKVKYLIEYKLDVEKPFIAITLLDMITGSYFQIHTFQGDKLERYNYKRILFKGIGVQSPGLLGDYISTFLDCFEFKWDILSLETEKYLNIARTKFKNEAIFKLKKGMHRNVINALMLFWEKCLSIDDNRNIIMNFIENNDKYPAKIKPIAYFMSAYTLIKDIGIDKDLIGRVVAKAFSATVYGNTTLEKIDESIIFSVESILLVKYCDGNSSNEGIGFYDDHIYMNIYKRCIKLSEIIKELNKTAKVINFASDAAYIKYFNKYFNVETIVHFKFTPDMDICIDYIDDEDEKSDFNDIEYMEVIKIRRKNNDIVQMNNNLDEKLYNKIIYSLMGNSIAYSMCRNIIYCIYPYGQVLSVDKVPNDSRVKDSDGNNELIIGNSYIISPFLMNETIPFELETPKLIQWLKDNMGLNELSKWVVENSSQLEQYKPNIEQVTKAYENLIEEYHKLYKIKTKE
ncbi:HD domain-containing protein [Clostridium lacusfryxellense]|uniref:HD domain-containing protein n=1 Tax=Clostridium lacusfryxellense TaxID=205328 RepID=UPI001C0C543C|nr:hypothetical protein [Clostridium lacusfryxellense]MBU3110830.1 hypothetical protein [Clostridium lacusfryxellense]